MHQIWQTSRLADWQADRQTDRLTEPLRPACLCLCLATTSPSFRPPPEKEDPEQDRAGGKG